VNALIPLPVILPIFGAALCVVAARSRTVQRLLSVSILTANVVVSVMLFVRVDDDGVGVTQAGGWRAPLGISLH